MRRRIAVLLALCLPVILALTWARTRRVAREQSLLAAAVDLTDALALAEGCLVGGGPLPARPGALEARVRRIALGDDGVAPWPARCARHLDPLRRATRGVSDPPAALRDVSQRAATLADALGAETGVARFREGDGALDLRWMRALDALRGAVAAFARSQGRAVKVPSSQHGPSQLPGLAIETLPLSLSPRATLLGTRAEPGVFALAWTDADGARVVCRTADQGVSVRCRRGTDVTEVFTAVDGARATWQGRAVSVVLREGVFRVRDVDGRARALTDDAAHGGLAVRAAWIVSLGARLLLVTAGEGVSMFWSDDGGRRWRATREGV